MRVAVTGATGFIGRPLVRSLLAGGHEITALSRNPQRAARVLPVRCSCAEWGPDRPPAPEVLRGTDAVIHLAGEGVADQRWTAATKTAIRTSRVLGARTLVDAVASLPPSERPDLLLSAAAIGYYGDRDDEELSENALPGTGFLAEVCRDWEREVAAADALGLRTAVIRVGVVLGTGGGALRRLLPPFRLGLGGRVGSGRQWTSWIHHDDVVALFRFVLEHPDARGPLNGVAPQPVTNATFTAALGRTLGRPTLLPVPALALNLALGEMSSVLLASQRVIPRAATALGFAFQHPEIDGALEHLCRDLSEEIRHEQWVPRPPEEVFPFFSDARNLEKLTPPFLRFRVLGATTPEIREGTCIDYRLSLHGVPVRWQSRIESWEPTRRFVDRQVRGPYRLWHHTHEFEPFAGGTIIRDHVRYELPLPPAGSLVAGWLVARDLERIFDFRRATIQELFGSGMPPGHT